MNLVAYDKVGTTIHKSKIYNDNKIPYIVTREVRKRKYYCYVKRYDPEKGCNVYFLVLLDDAPTDRQYCRTRMDDYGRLKFNLGPIQEIVRGKFEDKILNIVLSQETIADDGDIYRIEIEPD